MTYDPEAAERLARNLDPETSWTVRLTADDARAAAALIRAQAAEIAAHPAALQEARNAERERIAIALDEEANTTPCEEDAKVVRDCARLVRADFSYDAADALIDTPAPRTAERMTRLTVQVSVGDGAVMDIINPQSFADGGPEWRMRYGDPLSIRYEVAALLSSYDALLNDDITMTEATRRLRLMRARRRQLCERTA